MSYSPDAVTPSDARRRTAITFQSECWRAVCTGAIDGTNACAVVVAIRAFGAGALVKALLNSGFDIGKILGPMVVAWLAGIRQSVTRLGAMVLAMGALASVLVPAAPSEWVLLAGCFGQSLALAFWIPMESQVLRENYPSEIRGKLYSRTVMVRGAASMAFAYAFGLVLGENIWNYHFLFIAVPMGMLGGAFCLFRIPSSRPELPKQSDPWRALRYMRDDRLFALTLLSWMFMGLPNLVMATLRSEYFGNPRHGHFLAPVEIVLLTSIAPSLARILSVPVWGAIFDRVNLFVLRGIAHFGLAAGYLLIYNGREMPTLVTGALIIGLSAAAADVAWSLWATKLAPPGRVVDYMAVHSMCSGFRGLIAPVIGFQLAEFIPVPQIASVAVVILASANIVVAAEWIEFRRRKSGQIDALPQPA